MKTFDDCANQLNLTNEGRAQARNVGDSLRYQPLSNLLETPPARGTNDVISSHGNPFRALHPELSYLGGGGSRDHRAGPSCRRPHHLGSVADRRALTNAFNSRASASVEPLAVLSKMHHTSV